MLLAGRVLEASTIVNRDRGIGGREGPVSKLCNNSSIIR